MIKMISTAAIALAMTAGVASAQATTDRQAGAGLFDQGGSFGPTNSSDTYQATDGIDYGSTASITSDQDTGMGSNATMYETPVQAENNTVPSSSTFGGSSVLFDNSK